MKLYLGIDVGGTNIKGGLVDLNKGELVSERIKIPTPELANPENICHVIGQIKDQLNWNGPNIGVGFPSIMKNGIAYTATNLDKTCINCDFSALLKSKFESSFHIVNDADAAGLAEMIYGKGNGRKGKILLITLGTGIGSAIFQDSVLLTNTELGALHYKDSNPENYASNKARKEKDMKWAEYGKALNEFLLHVDRILSPDHIIVGGGISKKFDSYADYIDPKISIEAAKLQNNAGIIGAAYYASMIAG